MEDQTANAESLDQLDVEIKQEQHPPPPPEFSPPDPPSSTPPPTPTVDSELHGNDMMEVLDEADSSGIPDFQQFLEASDTNQDAHKTEMQVSDAKSIAVHLQWDNLLPPELKQEQIDFESLGEYPLLLDSVIRIDQEFSTIQLPLQPDEKECESSTNTSVRNTVGKKISSLKEKIRKASRLTSDSSQVSNISDSLQVQSSQSSTAMSSNLVSRRCMVFSDYIVIAKTEAGDDGEIKVGLLKSMKDICQMTIAPLETACALGSTLAGDAHEGGLDCSAIEVAFGQPGQEQVEKLNFTDAIDPSGSLLRLAKVLREALLANREKGGLGKGLGWKHRLVAGTLWSACLSGDPELVESMLEEPATGETSASNSESPSQRLTPVQLVSLADEDGASALHYAVLGGEAETLDLVLEHAEPNVLDNRLMSPLHYAAQCGNPRAVPVLVRAGCEPGVCDLQDRTALFFAVSGFSAERAEAYRATVSELLQGGVDPDSCDVNGATALDLACETGALAAIRAILLGTMKLHSGRNDAGTRQTTALHKVCASRTTSAEVVETLLSFGFDPNAQDENGDTPLGALARLLAPPVQEGTWTEKLGVALMLVSHGARLDIPNSDGRTPAMAAQELGLALDGAESEWELREAPKVAGQVAAQSVLSLPVAMDPAAPGYRKDGTVSSCPSCNVAFSFTTRRHHCRHCGNIFCSQCCSKNVPLCTVKESEKEVGLTSFVAVKSRVCIPCFNNACRVIQEAGGALRSRARVPTGQDTDPALVKESSTSALDALLSGPARAEADRAALFQDAPGREDAGEEGQGDSSAKEVQDQKMRVEDALQRTREHLVERGNKLESLADKTAQLQDGASNFAEMAKNLRQQQEKDNCVCS